MYNYITKSIRNTRWAIRNDGGVSENGLGTPRGVNHKDKTVMINPPGAYMEGANENFSPDFPNCAKFPALSGSCSKL